MMRTNLEKEIARRWALWEKHGPVVNDLVRGLVEGKANTELVLTFRDGELVARASQLRLRKRGRPNVDPFWSLRNNADIRENRAKWLAQVWNVWPGRYYGGRENAVLARDLTNFGVVSEKKVVGFMTRLGLVRVKQKYKNRGKQMVYLFEDLCRATKPYRDCWAFQSDELFRNEFENLGWNKPSEG
jgi:hypothetical protein